MRKMLVSRSSGEKPKPLERWVRTTSPSSKVICRPRSNNKEVRISAIQSDANNIGKLFNVGIISLTSLLYKLELMGYIKVIRTAGLDIINIITEMSFDDCILAYYRSLEQ